MSTRFLAAARRWISAILLVVGGLPAALELRGHREAAPDPGVHVESSNAQHHADHCLMSGAPSDPATPILAGSRAAQQSCSSDTPSQAAPRLARQDAWLTSRSRAPPVRFA